MSKKVPIIKRPRKFEEIDETLGRAIEQMDRENLRVKETLQSFAGQDEENGDETPSGDSVDSEAGQGEAAE